VVWKCPPLNLFNWNNLWKWKEEMPKYRIITSNISVYEHIVHADSEAEALELVDNGDSDMDWLDAHSQQVESIERIEG
jgi:hypothetical protein